MDIAELNQDAWGMVGQMLLVLIVIAPIAWACYYMLGRQGVTTDPWRARIDRYGRRLRACTQTVDSLISSGGGRLPIPDHAGMAPAELLGRMRKAGLVEEAHQQGFEVDVLPGEGECPTLRVHKIDGAGSAPPERTGTSDLC